jgi:hypothetical protein
MISQQGDKLWRECDICGTLYPLVSREFSPIFYGIPLTDSIRFELVEGTQTTIATFKVCPTCAGKAYANIIRMKKEAGNTSVL